MRVVAPLVLLLALCVGCQSSSSERENDEPSSSALESSQSIAEHVGERVDKALFIGAEQAQVPTGTTCLAAREKIQVPIGTMKLVNPTAKAAALTIKKKAGDERSIRFRYYGSAPQADKLEDCLTTARSELSVATDAQVVVPPNGEVFVAAYFVSEGDYPIQKSGSVPLEITTDALDDDATLGLSLAATVGEAVQRMVFVGPAQLSIPKGSTCHAGGEKSLVPAGSVKLVNTSANVASVTVKKKAGDERRSQFRVYQNALEPENLDQCAAANVNELSRATGTQVVVPPNGEAYVVAHFVTDANYPRAGTGGVALEITTDSLD